MDFMDFSEVNYSSYDNGGSDGSVDGLPSFHAQQVVAVVIYIVVFVVGVPGNALVLWATVSEARRSVNAIWFLNLAGVDLLSYLTLPIHIITALRDDDWLLGLTACRMETMLFYFNQYASVLLLATISADRFLLVFKPIWCQKYRVAWRAWLASGVAWMLALVLTIPSTVSAALYSLSKMTFCIVGLGLLGRELALAIIITYFVLTFLVPLVTMILCYTLLMPRTWRQPATHSTKILKMVVAVVTSFFVLWLPYKFCEMLYIFPLIFSLFIWELVKSLQIIGKALAYANYCINPVIYVATAAGGLNIQVFKVRPGQLRQLLTED